MRIAVFDPMTTRTDPAGSCTVYALLSASDEHDVTVYSSALDASLQGRVRFIRVPVIARPQIARYATFKVMATVLWKVNRARGRRYDLVQATETCISFAHLSYIHFCHTAFLKRPGRRSGGRSLRAIIRSGDHQLRAWSERKCYQRGSLVAVSRGLASELAESLSIDEARIAVIPNPVDTVSLVPPVDFDRQTIRQSFGVANDQLLLAFIALGHFERKGLPQLIVSLNAPGLENVAVVVVGGESDLIAIYRRRVQDARLSQRVHFTGWQADVRPWLWASDGFVLPSVYETFSLALHQAAAAGLPLIATPVHGAKELIHDGVEGFVVDVASGVADLVPTLRRFASMSFADRQLMGAAAAAAAAEFNVPGFQQRWLEKYRGLTPAARSR